MNTFIKLTAIVSICIIVVFSLTGCNSIKTIPEEKISKHARSKIKFLDDYFYFPTKSEFEILRKENNNIKLGDSKLFERLIERAFRGNKFSEADPIMFDTATELAVQNALGRLENGWKTTWSDSQYGELAFYPHGYTSRGDLICRKFKITKELNGIKDMGLGLACFNKKTTHWEWSPI